MRSEESVRGGGGKWGGRIGVCEKGRAVESGAERLLGSARAGPFPQLFRPDPSNPRPPQSLSTPARSNTRHFSPKPSMVESASVSCHHTRRPRSHTNSEGVSFPTPAREPAEVRSPREGALVGQRDACDPLRNQPLALTFRFLSNLIGLQYNMLDQPRRSHSTPSVRKRVVLCGAESGDRFAEQSRGVRVSPPFLAANARRLRTGSTTWQTQQPSITTSVHADGFHTAARAAYSTLSYRARIALYFLS